jgi:hypothetical protein
MSHFFHQAADNERDEKFRTMSETGSVRPEYKKAQIRLIGLLIAVKFS